MNIADRMFVTRPNEISIAFFQRFFALLEVMVIGARSNEEELEKIVAMITQESAKTLMESKPRIGLFFLSKDSFLCSIALFYWR